MNRTRTRRHLTPIIAAATILFGAAAGGGCTASHQHAKPAPGVGHATVYVALGGSDVSGGERRDRFSDTWPQVLYRTGLPLTTTFVNLADHQAGSTQILQQQADLATSLHPNLATITLFDDAILATPPAVLATNLTAIIHRVRTNFATQILVGTIPLDLGPPATIDALNQTIRHVTNTEHATLVNLTNIRDTDNDTRATNIAAKFTAALPTPNGHHPAAKHPTFIR